MGRTLATPRKPAARGSRHASSTPRTGRQRAATAGTDAQRERILQAAASLFASQGYAATTITQIAQALGVTKPFVYYYFNDKQEIFETLSWRPTVACFTAMDFPASDRRRAALKVREGIERLIRATIAHHPCAFFAYREPQVYRPEYLSAQNQLAHHFYNQLSPLLEQARRDGDLDFKHTRITALAACSLPGFLYTWYRPDGPLPPETVTAELTQLALRVLGFRKSLMKSAR